MSGFRPRGTDDDVFETPYTTPTLHVLGRNDVIVVEERSKTLLDVSENKRVEWHDGGMLFGLFPDFSQPMFFLLSIGHFVPSKASWRAFFREYLHDPTGDIPSPGPVSGSQPASGTATPDTIVG